MNYKFFILAVFLTLFSVSANSADTIIIHDTVYVFDSTNAVATSVAELKAEFYDRAVEGLERDKSYITLILTIIGIILIIIAGSTIYSAHLNKQAREEITREISRFQEKYEDVKLKAEEVDVIVEDLKQKSMHMDKEKEDAKTRLQMRPDEIDRLINSDDAKEVIPIYEKEFAKLEKTNEIDSLPPKVHKNAGLSYLRLKEYSKALFTLKRFLNSHPGDTEALYYSAVCLEWLGLYEQAIEQFAISIKSDAENLLGFNEYSYNTSGTSLGKLYDSRRDQSLLEQAIEMFQYAISTNDKYESAYYNLGTARQRQYDVRKEESLLEQATKSFEKAIAINGEYASAYAGLGQVLGRQYLAHKDESLLELSIENFKRADTLGARDVTTYEDWGLSLRLLYKIRRDENLIEDAIDKYQRAIEINHRSTKSHYSIAVLHSFQGQKEQMLSALEKAISLDSESAAMALEDEDFEAYWDDPDFLALVKPSKDDKKSKGKSKRKSKN